MNNNGTTHFSDYVKPERVLCALKEPSRDGVLEELVYLLRHSAKEIDAPAAVAAVLEREQAGSTLVGPGLALPHARLRGLKEPLVAIGLSPKGIVFDPGQPPARIIILVLTPQEDPSTYLRLVSALSRTMGDAQVRRHLLACSSPEEVCSILANRQDNLPNYLCARHLMNPRPAVLKEGDTLADAIRAMVAQPVFDLPVVDEEGDVKGVVTEEDIMRFSLPEHVLWMEDLSSILNFEPFVEVLRADQDTLVADFMRDEFASIEPDAPAIQLARMFVRDDVRQILVLDGKRLLGVVGQRSFITQLFWA